jgi:hypothetical protein
MEMDIIDRHICGACGAEIMEHRKDHDSLK